MVVLHGYGGQGKTALAAEAGRWLGRTGRFPAGAAFIPFERGGGADLALSWTRQALLGDDFADADAVAAALAERPGLVIFDNFESVLANGDAALADADLRDLLDLAWRWADAELAEGRTLDPAGPRVLITTRDTDFRDARFAPSRRCVHVALAGLARGEALALARAVLADRGIERAAIPREPLARLMDFLGGHPLSLNLVLPALARHTPDELIAEFDTLLPGFTVGAAKERNESLTVSLEFSLRRLTPTARAALPDLAVFAGGAFDHSIVEITELPWADWQILRAELIGAGLATVDESISVGVRLSTPNLPVSQFTSYPVRFHPTLLPYLRTLLTDDRRAALEERYWQRYYDLANYFYREDRKNPHFIRALAQRDLPNLRRGLDLALQRAAAQPDDADLQEAAAEFADRVARFFDVFGLRRERERLAARVDALTAQRPAQGDGAGLTRAEYLALSGRGETLLNSGRARDAEAVFRGLLARFPTPALDPSPIPDGGGVGVGVWAYERAVTLGRLGRALCDQGRPADAAECYRQELASLARQEQTAAVQRQAGAAHTDLADALADLGRYAEARAEYEAALETMRALDDRRSVAAILGQLGTLALMQADYAEARRRYTDALAAFRSLDEPEGEATAWHQLGRVAEEEASRAPAAAAAPLWAEAERCYRESLKLKEAANNLRGVANTANQLGLVCQNAGRPAEAETWYRRALAIDEQLGSQKDVAMDYGNLASLLLDAAALPPAGRPTTFAGRDLLAEAEVFAQRAREVLEPLGPSAEPWKIYGILAQIAERRGRGAEARGWRRKEQESFAAFEGAWAGLPQWVGSVGQAVAAACGGDGEARNQIEAAFPQFEAGNWRIVDAIRRIWAGERDLDALTDGIDRNSALIVRRILAAVAGEAPTPSPSPVPDRGG